MNLNWRKLVASLALVIVVVGIVVPDACAEDAFNAPPTSATVSIPHAGDQPFGCQHEEDCFCCAHIAPMALFVVPTSVVDVSTLEQLIPCCLEQIASAPYHPPKA